MTTCGDGAGLVPQRGRSLCRFFRLAAAIQAGEEGAGRIELAGDAPRTVILRPRAKLHPSLLNARIMVTGAGLELARVGQWLPGVRAMCIDRMIPETRIRRSCISTRVWARAR